MTAVAAQRRAGVPAPALVITGIVTVQLGQALAKQLFADVGSFGTVALRLFFASTILLAFWRPSLRLNRRTWAVVVAFGVTLALMNMTFYASLARIPLGMAVTIDFVGPIAVALLGSRRPRDVVWAALAAGGVVLLTEGGGHVDGLGVALALFAGVCWGAYIVLTAALGRRTAQGNGLALGMATAALIAVPIGVGSAGAALVQPWVLAAGLGVGLLSSVIPYSLELEALRKLPPRVFGVLMSLEPAMAAFVGLLLLGESLEWSQWLAIGLVVAASAGATRGSDPEA